ncbi:MAG: hypothetical protein AAGI91_04240 [Bacteroidota bacterium]
MKRFSLFLLLAFAAPVPAQTALTDDSWCTEDDSNYATERACEVRTFTLAARRTLSVDAGKNGGIRVEAWDRDEVQVLARVQAVGDDRDEVRRLVAASEVETDGTIRSRVPRSGRDAWVSVSFRLRVPRASNLDLEAKNGGIRIAGVRGAIRFDTQNGGVTLDALGGDVRGRTTNGGLRVRLTGTRWDGDGLDARTTNGGVELIVPDGYSADLETGTVNGRMRLGFPVLVEGEVGRRVRTTLGDGGPPVRAVTTNGGVRIERG